MTQDAERDVKRREFFDRCATGWEDRNYTPELRRQVGEMLAGLALTEGMTILDAGCGQGILLPFLRHLVGDNGRLIALDASAAMLEGVVERDAKTLAVHAPAEKIPLIDKYVDRVICFSAFPHFSDKAVVATEFFRVLKPGGRAYVLHIGNREVINRLHDMYKAVEGDHLPSEHGMRAIFTKAGFSDIILDEGDAHYYFSAVKQESVC
ncbi:MAG: methyltransferase domain-containing protein [Candidatus Accumulibacter sp.]|jgi:ubiquinone/menaquinone biosynthesis C-methylase UbiE|nr:methyltransferase domain-containing protein [Accumulibacter sp.]